MNGTSGGHGSAPLRLTRRGRALVSLLTGLAGVLVFSLMVMAGVAMLGGSAQATPAHPGSLAPAAAQEFSRHVVAPGETLWELAHGLDPQADTRDVVIGLMELNRLTSANVAVGTELLLPVG